MTTSNSFHYQPDPSDAAPGAGAPQSGPVPPAIGSLDDLGRIFNTALLTTRSRTSSDWSGEIQRLMASQAFHSLLGSIRHLARSQGLSEASAAEEIIRTVRQLDSAWQEYVFHEGLERLKS